MRSLGTIRSRVERLASVCLPSPEPMIIHEQFRYAALPVLRRRSGRPTRRRGPWRRPAPDRARGVVRVFQWADELTTCPRCGAPLPL